MIITPGEIQKEQYLTPWEQTIKAVVYSNRNMFGRESGTFSEYEEQEKQIKISTPWLKGQPFIVLDVCLPIIMVRNLAQFSKEKPLAPIMFFDTRYVSFLEVSKEYAESYVEAEKQAKDLGKGDILNQAEGANYEYTK